MRDIALFPIPDCVTFPNTKFPLHVFEPRYRKMVQHCIDHHTLMAVCHTQKILHEAKPNQSMEEALHSNQSTYKPYPVFSAGECELKQVMEDGRMLVTVHLRDRYRAVEEIQALPFSIYRCELYTDEPESTPKAELGLLKEKIVNRLLAITAAAPEFHALLKSDAWQAKDPMDFSFELFGILRLDADLQQSILELKSPATRLETVLGYLNQAPAN